MRRVRGKIDSRPSSFIERLIQKAVNLSRASGGTTATLRNAGQTSGSTGTGTGTLLTDPTTGKHYWSVGDPIDDDNYVLKP